MVHVHDTQATVNDALGAHECYVIYPLVPFGWKKMLFKTLIEVGRWMDERVERHIQTSKCLYIIDLGTNRATM